MVIYTIGHSTRSLDEFVGLLRAHAISGVADIRTVPKSRRHPHFSADALSVSLPQVGVSYRHFPGLGGLRKPRRDSGNSAWRHEGFRGYADYMETDQFREALADLIGWGGADPEGLGLHSAPGSGRSATLSGSPERRAAIMCAEAVWWRCHRQLTADALVARGVDVRHITGTGPAAAHKLTEFARVVDGEVRYPGLVDATDATE
jgi:uncharacterized protein (DUF488 family)